MSDFENGCAGSCDACGSKSDCEKATVTLTLDDGSMMECAILTIFEADEKEYIALLPWMKRAMLPKKVTCICTVSRK